MTKQTRLIDGRSYALETLTTQFDLLNRPLKVTYPTNEVVEISYDREGENTLKAGNDWVVDELRYNARGQMRLLDRGGSNSNTTYGYFGATGSGGNNNFRLFTIQHGSVTDAWPDMTYTYDTVGNIKTLNTMMSGSSPDNQTFEYDDLSRLKSAEATGGAANYTKVTYTYSEIGNIGTFEGKTYDYNNVSWNGNCTAPTQEMPHAVRKIGASDYFCYDGNGNMTKRVEGGVTYVQTFDVENRLVSVTVGSATTTFAYDASGQRVKTVEPGGKTTYFPFGNYEETVVGGSTIQRSSYALAGQVVAFRVAGDPVATNNGLFFIYGDHLGSTTMLGTSGGAFVAGSLTRYRPYGSYRTAPTQTLTDRDFTGQRENREIGLLYYNARFYHPASGRFISPDTIVPDPANPQSLNRYSYVENNPVNFSDPTGHIKCSKLGTEICNKNGEYVNAPPLTPQVDLTAWLAREMVFNVQGSEMLRSREILSRGKATNFSGLSGIAPDTRFAESLAGPFLELNTGYGQWDIKRMIRRNIGDSIVLCGSDGCDWFDYSTPGNIHYGYIAAAFGVPEGASLVAGGGLEVYEGTAKFKNWATLFEDPQDWAAVQFGYDLYSQFGEDMTLAEFQSSLTVEIRKTLQPPSSPIRVPARPQRNTYPPGAFDCVSCKS